jgi:hypothetical protein
LGCSFFAVVATGPHKTTHIPEILVVINQSARSSPTGVREWGGEGEGLEDIMRKITDGGGKKARSMWKFGSKPWFEPDFCRTKPCIQFKRCWTEPKVRFWVQPAGEM